MTYRQHSFDPDAYEQAGPPIRPFNWVQWTGVALGGFGLILSTLDIGGELGWIPQWIDDPSPWSFILLLAGAALINSRRGPSALVDQAQRERNRRLLLITAAICAAVLGVAAIIELQGA